MLDAIQVPKKLEAHVQVQEQPHQEFQPGKGGRKIDWHDYQSMASDGQRKGKDCICKILCNASLF